MTLALKDLLSRFKENILDILFPKICVGCGKEGKFLCADCGVKIKLSDKFICLNCGEPSIFGKTCAKCRDAVALDGALAATEYGNPIVRQAVYDWKYGLVKEMGEALGGLFLHYLERHKTIFAAFDRPLILPIPLYKKRRLSRGFNQADKLAEIISKFFRYERAEILVRTKQTIPQSELEGEERQKNMAGVFSLLPGAKEKISGRAVILVDDIYTSGATMNECAKLLKAAGAKEVWGVTLARG
jgi:ComF family protein